jgi:Cu/Ag efflux protein CusF
VSTGTPLPRRSVTAGGAVALLLLALGACHREPAAAPEGLGPPDATYTVRGVVWQLPGPAGDELTVHHEAIPEFVDRKGERSGMDSMTMPFGVAPDVTLADVTAGDKVAMTFELRWQDAQPLRIVRLEELPPDTELRLGAAAGVATDDPPAPAASPAATGGSEEASTANGHH